MTKKITIVLALTALLIVNIPVFAVYNVPYPKDCEILQYGYHPRGPKSDDRFLDITNNPFGDSMNGVSSANGNGYSDFWFRASKGNQIILNAEFVDTNGVSGTVTFTVRNKYTDDVIYDINDNAMECSFTSNNEGFMLDSSIATFTFNDLTDFYIEIKTENPTSTRCYGIYYLTRLDYV